VRQIEAWSLHFLGRMGCMHKIWLAIKNFLEAKCEECGHRYNTNPKCDV
jgi:hypothetical protein